MNNERKPVNWRQFLKLIQQTNPPKLILSGAIFLSVAATVGGLIIPLFTKNLVNSFSVTSISRNQILIMAGTLIVQAITSGLSIYALNYAGQKTVASLRDRLWKKLLVLPVSYYDNNRFYFDYRIDYHLAAVGLENDTGHVDRAAADDAIPLPVRAENALHIQRAAK
jgi:ATP-binding cassette, subfamily B, bacterial AbcA/BmrA